MSEVATEPRKRSPIALAISTVGVGYLPIAPGTWGSLVGLGIYYIAALLAFRYPIVSKPVCFAITAILLVVLSLVAFWAAGRTAESEGVGDPSIVVIDEVVGQLITFVFLPFTLSLTAIFAGFLLFRLFDIVKPYPVRAFEKLPGGIGICADDIVAGVYAGICLAVLSVFINF